MIVRSKSRLPILASDKKGKYPLLRLQTGVLFPENVLVIRVRRKDSLRLIEDCHARKREFVAAYSPVSQPEDEAGPVHEVGVFAAVRDSRSGPGGSRTVTIEGRRRAAIDEIVASKSYTMITANELQVSRADDKALEDQAEAVISIVGEITRLDPAYSPELLQVLKVSGDDLSCLADQVAAAFHFPLTAKQDLLEAISLRTRFDKLLEYLNAELTRVAAILRIKETARKTIREEREKHFPRRHVHESSRQLDEDPAVEKELSRILSFTKNSPHLPAEVVARVTIEADRLSRLPTASAEYGVTKNYIDWIMALPWGKCTPDNYEISQVEKIISEEYYGPANIKEQILQRLSIRKLVGGAEEGPTLCLVGAPGTGKASLAKAIARSLGKEFIRISVGGISEVSEIKGTPRTFLGAMPGKMIRALKDTGSCDPVILIDDIDYFNVQNDSSVNMALLEVVDTRLNNRFLDNYLGVPFDLSNVLFICSVRSFEEIPEQFIPRFELLEIPGYIEREKIAISKKYIIPNLLKKRGILKSEFRISEKVLAKIISNYTQEAGLLGFSQQIEKLCRRIALEKVKRRRSSWTISEKNLESFLGQALFIPEKAESLPEIGMATGLAWTGSGGELMFIEGLKMKGEGRIISTGSLGEVMKESIQAAHSYVRSKSDMLGIDFTDFNDFDIHIHFPSGAIPKDGPSAGVTVCLVVASVMAERPIRNDIAMTGEVTLRGRVLPVGGIKEKVSAAYRTGIYHVILPKKNHKDIKELPGEILRKIKFSFIERVDELFELCLMEFTPSSYTLEKVFAEEIEKAKTRSRKIPASKSKTRTKSARSRKK